MVLKNTPVWVWLVLLCLLYFGSKQTKTRQIKLDKLAIFPLIFLPFVIISVMRGHQPLIVGFALSAGLMIGIFLRWLIWKDDPLLLKTRASMDSTRELYSAYPIHSHFYF
ncbi:hypothetical protein ACNO7K_09335 [Bisgaard Taxon 45]